MTEPPDTSRARPTRRRWRRLRALALGCVGAAVVGEVLARVFLPAPFDKRDPQVRMQLDPAFRWAMAPDQDAYTLGAPVHINARGTRGREPDVPKREGVLRILGLGDSFAFGIGVADDETFYARLGALLSGRGGAGGVDVEVVNAAVPGYWTGQEIDWLERRGLDLQPDLVILQLYYNDLPRVGAWDDPDTESYEAFLAADRAGARPRRPEDDGVQTAEPEGASWLKTILRQSHLLFALRYAFDGMVRQTSPSRVERWADAVLNGESSPRLDLAWGAIETQLARAKAMLDAVGVRMLVVVMPMPQQLMGDYPAIRYQSRVLDMGSRLGIEVLDVEPAVRAYPDGWKELFIPYDWHLSARGHELVAGEIARVLTAKKLLPR